MLRRICLSTSTALALAALPAVAAAEPVVHEAPSPVEGTATPVVSQGDAVNIVGRGLCTIAFNDAGQRVSYTAGHCGRDGDRVIATGDGFRATGTFHPSSAMEGGSTANDWGVIRWADGVTLGPNSLSGDAVAAPSTMRSGDPVCVYGAASAKTTCGTFTGVIGNNVYWDGPSGKPGDSGGPVWVEGKGFLAVYTGVSLAVGRNGEEGKLNRSSVPDNGSRVSPKDEMELLARAKRITTPVVHETAVPGGTSTPVGGRTGSSAGSSSADGGEIAMIVIAVVAGVALALPEIVRVLPAQYREQLLRVLADRGLWL